MRILTLLFLVFLTSISYAQNTYDTVYDIITTKCQSCHSGSNPAGNLDFDLPKSELYDALVFASTNSSVANAKHNYQVYPGDPYRSYIFRKIAAGGFTPNVTLEAGEGSLMPAYGGEPLTDVEMETIRQWIVWGAPETGEVVAQNTIEEFYNGGGYWGLNAEDVPEAPAEGEGFQIRMGPFFVAPSDDVEYTTRYDTRLSQDMEVHTIDANIGSSHHFILLKHNDPATAQPYGLKYGAEHDDAAIVSTYQYSAETKLPNGTAFRWEQDAVLELNSHAVNYSSSMILGNDVYVNVYTQPNNTASQEMFNVLIPYPGLVIPNGGAEYVFEGEFTLGLNFDVHVWQMSSHTHQWGTGYRVWKRNPDGSKGDMIFDAETENGIPGCNPIPYDYQHPPVRTFGPFLPFNPSHGLIHEATYENNGPNWCFWGGTSQDEMMLISIYYVTSMSGVNADAGDECELVDIEDISVHESSINIYPNPADGVLSIDLSEYNGSTIELMVFDALGRIVKQSTLNAGNSNTSLIDDLSSGLYYVNLIDTESGGSLHHEKLVVR